MPIHIETVAAAPVAPPPATYNITGLTLVEIRAIRTLLGLVAPEKGSRGPTPTYRVFSALYKQFDVLPMANLAIDVTPRFINNGEGT